MVSSICGCNCDECHLKDSCKGCFETNGHPFDGECVVAMCCQSNGQDYCNKCTNSFCKLKSKLISEFNSLGIKDMPEITDLNVLKGSFVNLEYSFPSGQIIKLLDDNKIYLGNQVCKKGSSRCYGLAADESHILVCEYGVDGTDAEIVIYKKIAI